MSSNRFDTENKSMGYEKAYCDSYAAIVYNNSIVFSKTNFIAYLTQCMFNISKVYELDGYNKHKDDELTYPKSIRDYLILAHTVTAESDHQPFIPSTFMIGFKICIAGRLIIIRNNSNRYAYDCGSIKKWKSFFGSNFNFMTTKDIFFIWTLFKDTKHLLRKNISKIDYSTLIQAMEKSIKDFNITHKCNFKFSQKIVDFFLDAEIDILTELSYREIGLAITNSIIINGFDDKHITKLFKQMVRKNGTGTSLENEVRSVPHLPLLAVVIYISEQGRNYYSTFSNLLLLDLIESEHVISVTNKPISWLNCIISHKVYLLTNELSAPSLSKEASKKINRKIKELIDIGGFLCMSHTSSFYEHTLFNSTGGKQNVFSQAFYLQQALYGQEKSPLMLNSRLNFLIQMLRLPGKERDKTERYYHHVFQKPDKPNLSAEKCFMTVCEWLKYRYRSHFRILNKKSFNSAIGKDKPIPPYKEGNQEDFVKIFMPILMLFFGPHAAYDNENVDSLLNYYFNHVSNFKIIPSLSLSNEYKDSFDMIRTRLTTAVSKNPGINLFYFPLRINENHWVGFYIDRTSDNPIIYWLDPYGGPSLAIKNQLLFILNKSGIFNILLTSDHINYLESTLQKDKFNSGPWVIEILRFFRSNGFLPKIDDINIFAARKKHREILFHLTDEAGSSASLSALLYSVNFESISSSDDYPPCSRYNNSESSLSYRSTKFR